MTKTLLWSSGAPGRPAAQLVVTVGGDRRCLVYVRGVWLWVAGK